MRNVTAEEVKDACAKAGITRIDHHDCGGCHYMCNYQIIDGKLYFDPGCDCPRYGRASIEPRGWDDASNWINMQHKDEYKIMVAAKFGLTLA